MARLTAGFSLDGQTMTRIPAAFFSDIGHQDFVDLMGRRKGRTIPRETRRLWRLLQRADAPPKSVVVLIKASEALALYPPGSQPTGSIASALDSLWRDLIEN
jgi:hypothetical protein